MFSSCLVALSVSALLGVVSFGIYLSLPFCLVLNKLSGVFINTLAG